MCGIAGIVNGTQPWPGSGHGILQALVHRGPDDRGWFEPEAGEIILYHTRLSILDISPQSAQPFRYLHYTLVYNGEIYNYAELRQHLQQDGYRFETSGDTEVLAAAFDKWGIDCLHQLDGMFAFAIYDGFRQKLWLARDRFGEKPLYFFARYGAQTKLKYLLFASEMKALWAAGVPRQVNHKLMVNYLGLGLVQNPIVKTDTFFQEIQSLPPGYLIEVSTDVCKMQMRRWYKPYEQLTHLNKNPQTDTAEVAAELNRLLVQSVGRRLRSDVAVGTSLSGGLDSSAIVAAIHQAKTSGFTAGGWSNVCFTAIFPGFEKDELTYSSRVAKHYGLLHYTTAPTALQLAERFAVMMHHQEEPVQSSSVFTQYMVYATAAEEATTVLLDGQAADEILAGYPRYSHWYLQQLMRSSMRAMLAEKKLLRQNGMLEQWGWANYAAAYLPRAAAKMLQQKAWKQMLHAPLHPEYLHDNFDKHTLFKPEVKSLEDLLYFNTFNAGLEELLRYADRNSMAHGIEVRLPFLSHELVEYVFSLPSGFKIREGFGKWILRKAFEKHLPADIVWRRGKTGFEPPQAKWMQHEAMLPLINEAREKLIKQGLLQTSYANTAILASGAHAPQNYDWRILCAAAVL
jgi:asparagine synthase (glutamine-hydrolysing)